MCTTIIAGFKHEYSQVRQVSSDSWHLFKMEKLTSGQGSHIGIILTSIKLISLIRRRRLIILKKFIFNLLIAIIAITFAACNNSKTVNELSQEPSNEPEGVIYEIKDISIIGIEKEIATVFSKENIAAKSPMTQTFCGEFRDDNELVNSKNYPGNYSSADTFDVSVKGLLLTEQRDEDENYIYTLDAVPIETYAGGGMISFSDKEVSFIDGDVELRYAVVYNEVIEKDTLVGKQRVRGTELTRIKGISYCVDNKAYPVVELLELRREASEDNISVIIRSVLDSAKAIPFYFSFK